jgi:predicted transcriptional regulator
MEEQSLTSLMKIVGRADRTKFRHQVLRPLIDAGLVAMTIQDKPRSSRQRYRTTERGKTLLRRLDET